VCLSVCINVVCLVTVAHETEPFTPLDQRIEELRHHIHIESAVQEGAEKAITLLQSVKSNDKKAIQEVGTGRGVDGCRV